MGYFIGIDPGQKGAIVIIDGDKKVHHIFDMPLLPNHEINFRTVLNNIKLYRGEEVFCLIEKAQTMPKQGIVGAFSYGCGYEGLKTALQIAEIAYQEIPSSKWKKDFSLTSKKEESITKALELFPSLKKEHFYTPRGRMLDGRAEALLLALYAWRHFK